MSFEAISVIREAEENAKKTVAEAETAGKKLVADAELKGKAGCEAAVEKAASEIAELKVKSIAKAEEAEACIGAETETKKAVLIAKSDKQIEKAAMLIVERIVNA